MEIKRRGIWDKPIKGNSTFEMLFVQDFISGKSVVERFVKMMMVLGPVEDSCGLSTVTGTMKMDKTDDITYGQQFR